MKKVIETLLMLLLGAISLVYILVGATDFIPDVIPVIGNLDDAAAVTILVGVLSYFGFDVTRFFKGRGKVETGEKNGKGPVIEAETVEEEEKKD